MNQYDVESSVQPPYKVSFTGEAFPPLAQVVLGLVFKIPVFCCDVFVTVSACILHVVHFDMRVEFTVTFPWCHPRVAR